MKGAGRRFTDDLYTGAGPASLPAHLEGRETKAQSSGASRFKRNQWSTGKTRAPASNAGPPLWIPREAPFGDGGTEGTAFKEVTEDEKFG